MRRCMWAAALASVMAVAGAAWAQVDIKPIGKPAPKIPKPKEGQQANERLEEYSIQEKLPGHVVLIYFWRTSDTLSINLFPKMREIAEKYRSQGLACITMCPDPKEKYEKAIKDKGLDPFGNPNFFDSGYRNVQMSFGCMSHPEVALIDPWGIIVWRGSANDNVEERVKDLIAKTSPHAGDERWLSRRFREAESYYDKNEYGKAYWLARRVATVAGEGTSWHGQATGLMDKSKGAAENWLKEAIRLESEQKFDEAARIVAEIAVRMTEKKEGEQSEQRGGGSGEQAGDAARQAELEIGRMSGDRRLKEAIRKARLNTQGQTRIELAQELEEDKRHDEALEIYTEVVKTFEETDAAAAAKKAIERIEKDPAIRATVAKRRANDQADRWLFLAEQYTRAELFPQARETFERIIAEHADTDAAKKAKELLAKLPAGDGKKPQTP